MNESRRFSEREVREVFERAAAEQERAARRAPEDGLTLAEMQEVAASAGIDPAFVATAARAVALGEPEVGRETLGPVPTGVSRTTLLDAPPTDALWEEITSDARSLFDARGRVETIGRVREWRNGNLRLTLEPLGEGSRLRVRTHRRGDAQVVAYALVLALVAALAATSSAASGAWLIPLVVALALALAGGGLWVRQRAWAATRERQMEEIADRATALALPPATPSLASTSVAEPPAAASLRPGLDLDGLADDAPEATARAARRSRA